MSVKLFVTIDTEEDSWDQYRRADNPVINIDRLPILQTLFNRYGIIPTYLVNYPVASNQRATRILSEFLEAGDCEIGTHCHPWNNPPFEEEITANNSMMCNLAISVLRNKLQTLHSAIIENFHTEPICFRAGRWGFGPNVAKCIDELGYKVDSSITPFTDWRAKHGPNFAEAPSFSYWINHGGTTEPKSYGPILEVPPTIGFYQTNMETCARIRNVIINSPLNRLRLLGILNKFRILNYRWLSPETNTRSGMIRLATAFIDSGHNFLNMFFHSTALLPGCGPFVKTQKAVQDFLARLESFFDFANNAGFVSVPLSHAFDGDHPLRPPTSRVLDK